MNGECDDCKQFIEEIHNIINNTNIQQLIKQTAASFCDEIPAAYQDMVNKDIFRFQQVKLTLITIYSRFFEIFISHFLYFLF